MNEILATEHGLPPGLWLPTAEESTEQYLSENFGHCNHEYEDIVDYGAFIVALAVLGSQETGRISMMPRRKDFDEMRAAGYGVTVTQMYEAYDGLTKLQLELGFYPPNFHPTREQLLERFQWIADHAQKQDTRTKIRTAEDAIRWGAARHLTAHANRTYRTLGDTLPLKKMFGAEYRNPASLTKLDIYRFGDLVIRENGGPLSTKQLDERYADSFVTTPYEAIRSRFRTATRFWLEFGYAPTTSGINAEGLLDLGLRWAIANETSELSNTKIVTLSKEKRFPSPVPIMNHFGTLANYQTRLGEEYQRFLSLSSDFEANGVEPEVFKAVCHRYENSSDYADWLKNNLSVLIKLSRDTQSARWILQLIKRGFDLADNEIYDIQQQDFKWALGQADIKDTVEKQFVLALIPRTGVKRPGLDS